MLWKALSGVAIFCFSTAGITSTGADKIKKLYEEAAR
jgi:hypothetical protein